MDLFIPTLSFALLLGLKSRFFFVLFASVLGFRWWFLTKGTQYWNNNNIDNICHKNKNSSSNNKLWTDINPGPLIYSILPVSVFVYLLVGFTFIFIVDYHLNITISSNFNILIYVWIYDRIFTCWIYKQTNKWMNELIRALIIRQMKFQNSFGLDCLDTEETFNIWYESNVDILEHGW